LENVDSLSRKTRSPEGKKGGRTFREKKASPSYSLTEKKAILKKGTKTRREREEEVRKKGRQLDPGKFPLSEVGGE